MCLGERALCISFHEYQLFSVVISLIYEDVSVAGFPVFCFSRHLGTRDLLCRAIVHVMA